MTREFDEVEIVRVLEKLPVPARVAFAASCAQRIFPLYASLERGAGPQELRHSLSLLWNDAEGNMKSPQELQAAVDRCMALLSSVEEDETEMFIAEDAVGATAYALRTAITGNAQEAAWAARVAYELVDRYAISQMQIDLNATDAEARVLEHPLVQAELTRQGETLRDLESSRSEESLPQQVEVIRAKAVADGESLVWKLES